jgi:hypothetical protein
MFELSELATALLIVGLICVAKLSEPELLALEGAGAGEGAGEAPGAAAAPAVRRRHRRRHKRQERQRKSVTRGRRREDKLSSS